MPYAQAWLPLKNKVIKSDVKDVLKIISDETIPRIRRSYSSKRYPIPFDLNTILTKLGWGFIDEVVWMKP